MATTDVIQASRARLRTDETSFAMSCKAAVATLDAIREELMLLNVREPAEATYALENSIASHGRIFGRQLREAKRRAKAVEKRAEEHSLVEGL